MAVDDQYTKTLLHFNGSDTSTTFTDETGKVWSRGGTAQLDTGQYKFGGSSLLLDGNSDYISTPDHEDFNIGSGNFTIDFWIRFNYVPGAGEYAVPFCIRDAYATNNAMTFYYGGTTSWYINYSTNGAGAGSTSLNGMSTHVPSPNVWYHTAWIRNGNNFDIYIDGQKQTTKTGSGIIYNAVTTPLIGAVNASSPGYFVNGWIDEFRFSKGIARWTENFIPQSCQYLTGNYIHARRDRMNMNPVSTQNQIT